jgi:hypothetical protein
LRLATDHQLAAHTPRPRAPAGSLASVQVHQSALNNILDRLQLNGRTFTAEELKKHVFDRLRLTPPADAEQLEEDLELTFAEQDAVRVVLSEGRALIELSISELYVDSKEWFDLTARAYYKPVQAGSAVELVRDGPIQLTGDRLSTRSQIMLRGLFSRVFSRDGRWAVLKEPLETKAGLKGLAITQFLIEDGWASMAIGPRTSLDPSQIVRAE